MRLKLFSVFVLGFALGMATLATVLWTTGSLKSRSVEAKVLVPVFAPPAPPAPGTPAPTPTPVPTPPPAPTANTTPAPSSSPPEPDRAPALAMPIDGIEPGKLKDNFSEMHAGHPHEALDIMAPRGTPVKAVIEGNVVKLFKSKQGGLTVYQFDNARERCYYYAHLDHYAAGLKEGTLLRRGDVLGYVGSTGNAAPNAPHLHFAVFDLGPEKEWWRGTAIDPLPLLLRGRR